MAKFKKGDRVVFLRTENKYSPGTILYLDEGRSGPTNVYAIDSNVDPCREPWFRFECDIELCIPPHQAWKGLIHA